MSEPTPGEYNAVESGVYASPPEVGGSARGREAREHDETTEQIEPVREPVQARERDVRRADL
jgi:hypothetical protein